MCAAGAHTRHPATLLLLSAAVIQIIPDLESEEEEDLTKQGA